MHHSDLIDIIEKAGTVVARACAINHHEGKKGGYLCVATPNGLIGAVALIGEVPDPEKARKYFEFCQEKAVRLAGNRGHVSSFQSKDEALNRWGGAIRCRDCILSFSGLPELWDEACVLTIGYLKPSRMLTNADVENICHISDNTHARRLIVQCTSEADRLRA